MVKKGKKRVSATQWLQQALALFAKTGEGGLKVESLARALNVSKSGFYFHFKDRDEFLLKLVDYWAHEYTEVVTGNPLLIMAPPRERLLMIATFVFEQNLTEFDAGMYLWANKDSHIAKKVRRVTDMRLAFAGNAFAELGFEGEDRKMRARLFIGFLSGERSIFGANKKTAQRYREMTLDLLLGTPA